MPSLHDFEHYQMIISIMSSAFHTSFQTKNQMRLPYSNCFLPSRKIKISAFDKLTAVTVMTPPLFCIPANCSMLTNVIECFIFTVCYYQLNELTALLATPSLLHTQPPHSVCQVNLCFQIFGQNHQQQPFLRFAKVPIIGINIFVHIIGFLFIFVIRQSEQQLWIAFSLVMFF